MGKRRAQFEGMRDGFFYIRCPLCGDVLDSSKECTKCKIRFIESEDAVASPWLCESQGFPCDYDSKPAVLTFKWLYYGGRNNYRLVGDEEDCK